VHRVPPYVVFSDRTLHEMCRYFPVTLPDMRGISGVGDTKLERYGEEFVREIRKYRSENPDIPNSQRQPFDRACHGGERSKMKEKSETVEETYEYFKEGMSFEDVAKLRNLASPTIASHLERLIREGREIDMDRLVGPVKRKEIGDLFLSLGQWGLNAIVEHFNGAVTYEEARLVRAWLLRNTQE